MLNEGGDAMIVPLARGCEGETDSMLAFVHVVPPERMRLGAAEHGVLLSPSMVDPGPLFDALRSWGVATPRPTAVAVESAGVVALGEARITADPDFLLTVDGAGLADAAPFGTLRVFEIDYVHRVVLRAFDTERPAIKAIAGPATAHFVWQGVGDIPDHRLGTGLVAVSGPVDVTYRPAALPAAAWSHPG